MTLHDAKDAGDAEAAIQREINSVREDIAAHIQQAESLLKMFRLLLQRVDIISHRHEETVADNIRLRAMVKDRDAEILRLLDKLKAAGLSVA